MLFDVFWRIPLSDQGPAFQGIGVNEIFICCNGLIAKPMDLIRI